ncbi:MAG: HAMP domain-containing histidine kinase [Bdellovibrio sp.]|nr:HAMP domain-containing histidine kinase [Bdellovibrio sp.]
MLRFYLRKSYFLIISTVLAVLFTFLGISVWKYSLISTAQGVVSVLNLPGTTMQTKDFLNHTWLALNSFDKVQIQALIVCAESNNTPIVVVPDKVPLVFCNKINSFFTSSVILKNLFPSTQLIFLFKPESFYFLGLYLFVLSFIVFYLILFLIKNRLQKRHEIINSKVLGELAAQVAHDIRSPLAALSVVQKDLALLPEESRILVRGAIDRIRNIANNLIEKNRDIKLSVNKNNTESNLAVSVNKQSLMALVDTIVSEKRTLLKERSNIQINWIPTEGSYAIFAQINNTEFKRILSNLINNAVEAMENVQGTITISLRSKGEQVCIEIIDSGKGIPKELLNKLGKRGVTFGKKTGSGLGLYHAKSTVVKLGGNLEIDSQIGQGTKIIITLAKADPPIWFVSELKVLGHSKLIILDDDDFIHTIWENKFRMTDKQKTKFELVHFYNPNLLFKYLKENKDKITKDDIFLVDYELVGFNSTGVQIIEEHKLQSQAILVTSRYDDEQVLKRCESQNIKLIAKPMAPFVPICYK